MTQPVENHQADFQLIEKVLHKTGARSNTGELSGIGRSVVHGGERFFIPTIINSEVIETIRRLIPLRPCTTLPISLEMFQKVLEGQ